MKAKNEVKKQLESYFFNDDATQHKRCWNISRTLQNKRRWEDWQKLILLGYPDQIYLSPLKIQQITEEMNGLIEYIERTDYISTPTLVS